MEWFGPTWSAPVNESREVPPPIGETCGYYECGNQIEPFERGVQVPVSIGNLDPKDLFAFWFEPGAADPNYPRGAGYRIAYHIDCWLRTVLGPMGRELVARTVEE